MENNFPSTTGVVLLAGGQSQRLGQPKGLVVIPEKLEKTKKSGHNNKTWLEYQLDALGEIPTLFKAKVAIVLGHHQEQYLRTLPFLRAAISQPQLWEVENSLEISTIANLKPELGSFSSLQTGLGLLASCVHIKQFFVLPIDVPCPAESVWQHLSESLKGGIETSIPMHSSGRGGHPVLLSRVFALKLLDLPADKRLDFEIKNLSPEKKKRVTTTDQRTIQNLNTPEDWNNFTSPQLIASGSAVPNPAQNPSPVKIR